MASTLSEKEDDHIPTANPVETPPKATEPVPYKMPRPIGLIVEWRASGDAPGSRFAPAIVVKQGHNALSLLLFADGAPTMVPKSGVRHISDPDNRNPMFEAGGTWDYTAESRALIALAATLGVSLKDLGLE